MNAKTNACVVFAITLLSTGAVSASSDRETKGPKTLRDLMWVWAVTDIAQPEPRTLATYADAGPAERARLLGVPNVVMAGEGLPDDDQKADRLMQQVSDLGQVIWEVSADKETPFVYQNRTTQVRRLMDKYPRIGGVLLDDMSTVAIDKGLKPEHIRNLRKLLTGKYDPLRIWGVLYTMNLDRPQINDYVHELDVINLWTWHAKDVVNLERNVAHCERTFPGKPIMLGLYLYDYGEGRRMPHNLLEQQCETALKLAQAGRVQGIVFLSITNDAEAVTWTADWIKRVGQQALGSPATQNASSIEKQKLDLKIGARGAWNFFNGPWTQNADGIISPTDQRNLHSRAFYTPHGFKDFTAEFEFNPNYRETGSGGAGLLFRASDPNHFYSVYFPWGGQQLRAKHFWGSVIKVDGDGYWRSLKSAWVPGVPSETDRWYKVKVVVEGPNISVWVDGRRAFEVSDATYQSGAIGLAGYGWYFFRNVRISGEPIAPPVQWNPKEEIPVHHFAFAFDSEFMPSGCVAPNGDVLLASNNQLARSRDKGRTWDPPEKLPDKLGSVNDYGNTMYRTSKGRLMVQLWQDRDASKPLPQISISESTDNGKTWSDPTPSIVAEGWPEIPEKSTPYGPLLETADGTLLRFFLGGVKEPTKFTNVVTWGSIHAKAFALRSTDGGKSWSKPIEVDQPAFYNNPRGSIPGSLDLTEPVGVAIGNTVTVCIRPVYSTSMWQCWSNDAGATWDSAARTTFPGYAPSMIRTQSGAILCAHRYPHYSINISRDDGLNWDEGTIIDYAFWGMGCLVEVEPDVVLCTYMNAERKLPLLGQLIRVTPEGLKPVTR